MLRLLGSLYVLQIPPIVHNLELCVGVCVCVVLVTNPRNIPASHQMNRDSRTLLCFVFSVVAAEGGPCSVPL